MNDGILPLPTSARPSSLALAEHLQAGSKAYDRLVENIKGDWLVVDPSPLVVTPTSSTVQSASPIIVKLPSSVDRESRIEDHQNEEDASGSEVESEAEEEDGTESEDWSVGEGEDFDPKLAKLEIALLRAKLKLVRVELAQARGDVDRKTSKKSVTVDAPLSYLESIE
ncbi:hypothetical protein JCM5350_006878 [Sporobolomyces pararoseus]